VSRDRVWETYVALSVLVFSALLLGCMAAYVQLAGPDPSPHYDVQPRTHLTCRRGETATFEFTNEYHKPITVYFTGEVACTARSIEP
jgi:hypothetical protein